MEKSVKDFSFKELFQVMYCHDFSEPELVGTSNILKCGEVSCKDKRLMEIVERRTSRKGDIMLSAVVS